MLSAFSVTGWDGTATSGSLRSAGAGVGEQAGVDFGNEILRAALSRTRIIPSLMPSYLRRRFSASLLTIPGTPVFKVPELHTNGTLRKNGILVAGTVTVGPGESLVCSYDAHGTCGRAKFMLTVTDGVVDSAPPVRMRKGSGQRRRH